MTATVAQFAAKWDARLADLGLMTDPFRPAGSIEPGRVHVPAWNNVKVLTLWPAYRVRFAEFIDDVNWLAGTRDGHADGRIMRFMIWDAARSVARQATLYERGRLPTVDKRKQVTWTIASNHLGGCAIDVIADGDPTTPTGEPSFALPRWWVKDALPFAAKCGLRSLYLATGKDPPHIEVPPKDVPPEVKRIAVEMKREWARVWAAHVRGSRPSAEVA